MVHRRIDDLDVHLVVNTGPHRRTQRVVPRDARSRIEVWDPKDGAVVSVADDPGPNGIEVALAPYQALVLVGHDGDPSVVDRPSAGGSEPDRSAGRSTPAGGSSAPTAPTAPIWARCRSPTAGRTTRGSGRTSPARWPTSPRSAPRRTPARSGSTWATAARPTTAEPAGSSGIEGHSYRVQLVPPVGEVVRVLVDDVPVATLWAPPYACDLTDQLRGTGTVDAATGGVEHDGQRPGRGRHRGRLGGRRGALARSPLPDAGPRAGARGPGRRGC